MKKTIIYSFIALSTLIFSCKEGPEGPVGPAGPQGANGKDGAQGAAGTPGQDGKDAESSVKSTGWMKLDFTGGAASIYSYTSNGSIYQTYVSLKLKSTVQPLFTKDIIDNGVIIYYIRYNTMEYDNSLAGYNLVKTISGGSAYLGASSYFKIDGRTTDNSNDFASVTLSLNGNIRENYWDPNVYFNSPYQTNYVNGSASSYSTTAPELLNKPLSFYRELVAKHQPEIRIVTIKGAVGARMKNIDFTNYELVKATFNLED
ncbi:hypothetical protein GVN16_14530 [Emticicia sp. CRIBPO]|uniref:collagen-like protein n=1 Tax=Emticicia sp. CRIBPO TaxID=2683258 RepID=UPI0014133DBD|nr:collagen-like protein [Emticicia sp. CRIBPO]NBA86985.1 hypothetical protein [Emticicia sp. CRIBPO]